MSTVHSAALSMPKWVSISEVAIGEYLATAAVVPWKRCRHIDAHIHWAENRISSVDNPVCLNEIQYRSLSCYLETRTFAGTIRWTVKCVCVSIWNRVLPYIIYSIFWFASLAMIVPAYGVFFGIISHWLTNRFLAMFVSANLTSIYSFWWMGQLLYICFIAKSHFSGLLIAGFLIINVTYMTSFWEKYKSTFPTWKSPLPCHSSYIAFFSYAMLREEKASSSAAAAGLEASQPGILSCFISTKSHFGNVCLMSRLLIFMLINPMDFCGWFGSVVYCSPPLGQIRVGCNSSNIS